MGQAVLRGDKDRERVGGRVGENSRDGPKHDTSGLELAKLPSIYPNIARSDIEEESENSEVSVGPRMGSLTNAYTGERGTPSEAVLDRVIPSPVVVGKDPAVGEAGEGYDENVKFTR
jgi:hypothetical protein